MLWKILLFFCFLFKRDDKMIKNYIFYIFIINNEIFFCFCGNHNTFFQDLLKNRMLKLNNNVYYQYKEIPFFSECQKSQHDVSNTRTRVFFHLFLLLFPLITQLLFNRYSSTLFKNIPVLCCFPALFTTHHCKNKNYSMLSEESQPSICLVSASDLL